MKRTKFWLLLLGIGSVVVIYSCKSDKISPIKNILGYYTDGGTEDVYLEIKKDNNVLVKVNLYQQGTLPDGTYGYRFKVYPFPNCEIVVLDTVIVSAKNTNQNQFYAKIINHDNNTILGEITKWDSYQTATKRSYFALVTNNSFNIKDTLVKNKVFIKWID